MQKLKLFISQFILGAVLLFKDVYIFNTTTPVKIETTH